MSPLDQMYQARRRVGKRVKRAHPAPCVSIERNQLGGTWPSVKYALGESGDGWERLHSKRGIRHKFGLQHDDFISAIFCVCNK